MKEDKKNMQIRREQKLSSNANQEDARCFQNNIDRLVEWANDWAMVSNAV